MIRYLIDQIASFATNNYYTDYQGRNLAIRLYCGSDVAEDLGLEDDWNEMVNNS